MFTAVLLPAYQFTTLSLEWDYYLWYVYAVCMTWLAIDVCIKINLDLSGDEQVNTDWTYIGHMIFFCDIIGVVCMLPLFDTFNLVVINRLFVYDDSGEQTQTFLCFLWSAHIGHHP